MKRKHKLFVWMLVIALVFTLSGCSVLTSSSKPEKQPSDMSSVQEEKPAVPLEIEDEKKTEDGDNSEDDGSKTEDSDSDDSKEANGYCIVIDPGHQIGGNSDMEPDGPGSPNMKAKVTTGTSGVSTHVPEYELTLSLGLKLREELEKRGYEVILTRETNDVDISNAERAKIANEAEADAFIRIHADGSSDSGASGMMTICQTSDNPYNAVLYEKSLALSEAVLAHMVEKTKAKDRGVWKTDTMSGINWASVPVTIVEVGFMTNPEEDERMQTEEYQKLLTEGMADGIDTFLSDN